MSGTKNIKLISRSIASFFFDRYYRIITCIIICWLSSNGLNAQDTLKVMTYNVLHYGDLCQGSNLFLHSQLKTIIRYESPDVLGLVKAQVIKRSANDFAGVSPVGFADSILTNGLNSAFANRYDYCPIVNFSNDVDGDMSILFYNKSKLGFVSVTNLYGDQEDFNLYKLYYKDPNLATIKDSTYLYFILNHTVSGTDSGPRDSQTTQIVANLKKLFSHLPNLISMGDFNTHSSLESGYQLLTASKDTSFIFNDPPFAPDKKLTYPANWDSDPESYSAFLNTSTRSAAIPNACGTTGGAKNWYLHMFLSPWMVENKNYANYVRQSYRTIGNDGKRVSLSINDSTSQTKNLSVPDDELNALFHLSDKYPVLIKIVLSPNTKGISLPDPVPPVITAVRDDNKGVSTSNPVGSTITFNVSPSMLGQVIQARWIAISGQEVASESFVATESSTVRQEDLSPGVYILCIQIQGVRYYSRIIKTWD